MKVLHDLWNSSLIFTLHVKNNALRVVICVYSGSLSKTFGLDKGSIMYVFKSLFKISVSLYVPSAFSGSIVVLWTSLGLFLHTEAVSNYCSKLLSYYNICT